MTLADLRIATDPYLFSDDDELHDGARANSRFADDRILVVDDDATASTLMRRLLERDGFSRVAVAGDGRRALEMISAHRPDVVVLDVHLPRLDGYEVLREIVRRDEGSGRPTGVLGVSGDPTSATGQSMLFAGADDFIPRPFESADFTQRVRRLATRTRSLRRAVAYSQFLERGLGADP